MAEGARVPTGRLLAALVTAAALATGISVLGPRPSADVSKGTERVFASSGLYPRELSGPSKQPQVWTKSHATFAFADLPQGVLHVSVMAHGHRGPVVVKNGDEVLGTIEPGRRRGLFDIRAHPGGGLVLSLDVPPFRSGDRELGTLVDRVEVDFEGRGWPSPVLLLAFVTPALLAAVAGLLSGLPGTLAVGLSVLVSAAQALSLLPGGAARSSYSWGLSMALCATALFCLAFARKVEGGYPGAGAWAYVALTFACLVEGIWAASPLMVVSDAEFHAHKLLKVAAGDFFPTSLTPGTHPFVFPYGVSFYLFLSPLALAGINATFLVRLGAALSGIISSSALFVLLVGGGRRRAFVATVLLQLLPVTFDLYSFGNLSNVFGQAVTVVFFLWWACPFGGAAAGALLLAIASLAHLSSFVVLVAFSAAVALLQGRGLLTDRLRIMALSMGLLLAALYYSSFARLALAQLPRVLEGGAGRSVMGSLLRQGVLILRGWGIPATLLALVSCLGRGSPGRLRGDLRAFWLAGLSLCLLAAVSPLEVRYIHALTLPLSVAAASGLEILLEKGWAGRALSAGLLAWQLALFQSTLIEDLLHRYRP